MGASGEIGKEPYQHRQSFLTLPLAGVCTEPIRNHADVATDHAALIAGAFKACVKEVDGAGLLNVERLSRRRRFSGVDQYHAADPIAGRERLRCRTANVTRADDRHRCPY